MRVKVEQLWYQIAEGLEKDEVINLLKLVLDNCVFPFQDKFYKQLHSTAVGSPCSPVLVNIFLEYFEQTN